MLSVSTLSGFLPSLSSSSMVCAKAGPHHSPTTDASSQSFFMVVLPSVPSALSDVAPSGHEGHDGPYRIPRRGANLNEGPDETRSRETLGHVPFDRRRSAGRHRAHAGAIRKASRWAEP